MIKVKKKYYNVLFSFLMAGFMSAIMSFVLTIKNLGLIEDLILVWIINWMTAFCIAFPIASFFVPKVKKLMERVFTFS
jgi:cytochrome c biogenesis factor